MLDGPVTGQMAEAVIGVQVARGRQATCERQRRPSLDPPPFHRLYVMRQQAQPMAVGTHARRRHQGTGDGLRRSLVDFTAQQHALHEIFQFANGNTRHNVF